jgi:6,7-dimethyl-8-ribityllumazine synthase
MSEHRPAEVPLRGDGMRVCIVAARFNGFVVERLLEGALAGLRRSGVAEKDITVLRIPGAFEIPAVARRAALSGGFEAVVALGCVIRGATAHFEYVAGECARGLANVAAEASLAGVSVVFGVLTVNTKEQALERAVTEGPAENRFRNNSGHDAALAAIETWQVLRSIQGRPDGGHAR